MSKLNVRAAKAVDGQELLRSLEQEHKAFFEELDRQAKAMTDIPELTADAWNAALSVPGDVVAEREFAAFLGATDIGPARN